MSDLFFARVQPDELKITETYSFEQTLDRALLMPAAQSTSGQISAQVSYDGDQSFTRQALADVRRQWWLWQARTKPQAPPSLLRRTAARLVQPARAWQQRLAQLVRRGAKSPKPAARVAPASSTVPSQALIGHLLLEAYDRTDLKARYDLYDRFGAIALPLPIQTQTLEATNQMIADDAKSVLTADYQPQALSVAPLRLAVQISDSWENQWPGAGATPQQLHTFFASFSDASQAFTTQNHLRFSLRVELNLPSASLPAGTAVSVKQVWLAWPGPLSTNHEAAYLIAGEATSSAAPVDNPLLKYNPLEQRLEWGGMPLQPATAPTRPDLTTLVSEPLHLIVKRPADLYQIETLDGQLEIELPDLLLSGLGLRYYDSVGRRHNGIAMQKKTRLVVRFKLVLADLFAQRQTPLLRRVFAPAVTLRAFRPRDLFLHLADLGFSVTDTPDVVAQGRHSHDWRVIFRVQPMARPQALQAWVMVRGQPGATTIGGLLTRADSQDAIIQMGALSSGSQVGTALALSDLQAALISFFEPGHAPRPEADIATGAASGGGALIPLTASTPPAPAPAAQASAPAPAAQASAPAPVGKVEATIKPQAALARCDRCGSPDVAAVCHECRRPVCQAHGSLAPRWLARLLFHRFAGLGLENTPCGPDPLICPDCRGKLWTPGAWLILIGSLLALLAVGILAVQLLLQYQIVQRLVAWLSLADEAAAIRALAPQRNYIVGTVGLGLLVSLAGYAYRGRRPFLPLIWTPQPGQVVETLTGKIELKAQAERVRLQTAATACSGEIKLPGQLKASERKRLEAYRDRFKLPKPSADAAEPVQSDLEFRAGYALLKGRFGGVFKPPLIHAEADGRLLRLLGQVREHALFSGGKTRSAARWDVEASYDVAAPDKFPVRLFPHLVETRDQRTVELELQWDDGKGLSEAQIELLRIDLPASWGKVVDASDPALVSRTESNPATGLWPLEWNEPPLSSQEQQARRRFFRMQFERNIEADAVLRGQVIMTWRGALSGLQGVGIFFPLGRTDTRAALGVQSRVSADFELSLAGLRFQDVRIMLDPQRLADRDRTELIASREIRPDQTLAATLTRALLEKGYLVLGVMEETPRFDLANGALLRQWSIFGRTYSGVVAVDFHLIISGSESSQAVSAAVKLTAHGLHTQPAAERLIERTWKQLFALARQTFATRTVKVVSPANVTRLPAQRRSRSAAEMLLSVLLAEGALSSQLDEAIEGEVVESSQLLSAPTQGGASAQPATDHGREEQS